VLPEGISKKIVQDGTGSAVRVGDVVNVKYSCFLPPISGEERLLSLKPFAKSKEQKLVRLRSFTENVREGTSELKFNFFRDCT
jgi:hypothetical protein